MINLDYVRDIGRRMSAAVERRDAGEVQALITEARDWGRTFEHVHPADGYRIGVKYRMTVLGSVPLPAAAAAVKHEPVDPWVAMADLARGYQNIELHTFEASFIGVDPNQSSQATEFMGFRLCLFRMDDGSIASIAPSDVLNVEVV